MNQLVFEVNPSINMARSYSEYVQTLLSTQAYIRKTYVSPSNSTVSFPQGHPSGDFPSQTSQELQQAKLQSESQESLYMPQSGPTDQQQHPWPVGYPFTELGSQQSQIEFYLNTPKVSTTKRTRKRKTPLKSDLFGLNKELEERPKTKKNKDQEKRVEKMQLREERRLPRPKRKKINVQEKKFKSREFVFSLSSSSAISVRKHDEESYIPNHDHLFIDDEENDDFDSVFNPDSNFVCPLEPRHSTF